MDRNVTDALPPGTMLADCYRIERVLGFGGFGITYLAHDTNLNAYAAIKEYFMGQGMTRQADQTVTIKDDADKGLVEWGLKKFTQEARTLAQFPPHPNIVRVSRLFEQHGTAYIVQEYVEGTDLQEKLAAGGASLAELKQIAFGICDGLREVHRQAIQHLDIKPSNIRLRRSGVPVLIDFGAARHEIDERAASEAIAERVTSKVVHSHFYSAHEIFAKRSSVDGKRFGPWTDIYSLCAVLYLGLTGEPIPETSERTAEIDPYKPLENTPLRDEDPDFVRAIDWGLQLYARNRPQSVEEWLAAARGEPSPRRSADAPTAVVTAADTPTNVAHFAPASPARAPARRQPLIAGGLLAVALLAMAIFYFTRPQQPANEIAAPQVIERTINLPQRTWTDVDLAAFGGESFRLESSEPFRVRHSDGIVLVTPDRPIFISVGPRASIALRPVRNQPSEVRLVSNSSE